MSRSDSALPSAVMAKWRRARADIEHGRMDSARTALRQLASAYPGNAGIQYDLGSVLTDTDYDGALAALHRAAALAGDNVPLLLLTAHRLQNMRCPEEAGNLFARAASADAASVDAQVSRAVWLERTGRLEEASQAAEAALTLAPGDDQTRYLSAWLCFRRGEFAAAESAARDLIQSGPRYPYVVYAVRYLLAHILDVCDQPDEAMRWLKEAKSFVRSLTDVPALLQNFDLEARAHLELAQAVHPQHLTAWQDGAAPLPYALLAGHARSGTTLLERVAGANPAITAVDESPAFAGAVLRPLHAGAPGNFAVPARRLLQLSSPRLAALRENYRRHLLRGLTEPPRGLILDKNPSLTALLPVWLRLFPGVPVIIALRHPLDVVLSCYFQNLPLNRDNANFLTLERTAVHYAAHMEVWLSLRERLTLPAVTEVSYERFVRDPAGEGARLTRHLGGAWDAEQIQPGDPQRRAWIAAPTYREAAQPVYTSAAGRWQKYARYLEPVVASLDRFIRAFA